MLKNILLTLNRLCVDIKKLRMDCIKIRDIWAVSGCKLRSLLKQTTYSLTKKQTNNLLILRFFIRAMLRGTPITRATPEANEENEHCGCVVSAVRGSM